MQGSELTVERLSKTYGAQPVLDAVQLQVAAGQFVALLGPSGCGKTTLLRCVAGLVRPDAGDIRVNGRSVRDEPVHRRNLGMVFQNYALFPHMTVAENVAFGLRMRRIGRAQQTERVRSALELVRLGRLEGRVPAQLSGGQQQRVALARSLVTDPAVLLLDESLSALDAKLREAMQVELRQLQHRIGITTVFVTHDQREAMVMADRIAIMNAGRVAEDGAPETVYDRPASAFGAAFLGQVNCFRGQAGRLENGWLRAHLTGIGEVVGRAPTAVAAGRPVIGMIRPQRLRLDGSGQHSMTATLREVLFTGERVTCLLDTAAGEVSASCADRGAIAHLTTTASVRLGWEPQDLHLFPADSADSIGI